MLDIISNALAGTMCLFFALSAVQLEPPEATRILGQLTIEVELIPSSAGAEPPSLILIAPNKADGKRYDPLYDEEILLLNNDYLIGGLRHEHLSPVQVYRDPDNPLSMKIHVNDPKEGLWTVGAIYVDSQEYPCSEGPVNIRFKAYFDKDSGEELTSNDTIKPLDHPTEIAWFNFEPAIYSLTEN